MIYLSNCACFSLWNECMCVCSSIQKVCSTIPWLLFPPSQKKKRRRHAMRICVSYVCIKSTRVSLRPSLLRNPETAFPKQRTRHLMLAALPGTPKDFRFPPGSKRYRFCSMWSSSSLIHNKSHFNSARSSLLHILGGCYAQKWQTPTSMFAISSETSKSFTCHCMNSVWDMSVDFLLVSKTCDDCSDILCPSVENELQSTV
jgi:hypothetical protein